jgi:pantothenate kinase
MESVLIIMRARLNGFPGSFDVHGLLSNWRRVYRIKLSPANIDKLVNT